LDGERREWHNKHGILSDKKLFFVPKAGAWAAGRFPGLSLSAIAGESLAVFTALRRGTRVQGEISFLLSIFSTNIRGF
jgi:hypothetical protein